MSKTQLSMLTDTIDYKFFKKIEETENLQLFIVLKMIVHIVLQVREENTMTI